MLCDGLNNERQYEVYRPLARLYFMKKYLRWSSKVFFFPPAAPFLSCNLSQFRKSEKWKIFALPTADTWLPPIGLRGWLDGENPLFPLLPFPLSPPPRPERLLCLPFSGPTAQPAWPPGPWLARATPSSLLGWLARLGCTPYPRVFLFLILFTFFTKKYSKFFLQK